MVGFAANRAVFLDRDGVIVVPEFRDGRSFAPRSLSDFRIFPDAEAGLRRLKQAGFLLVVVTNQPDVGAGVISSATLDAMHRCLRASLPIDAIKVCTHQRSDDCDCRKPRPGMLLSAARELSIDCASSFMVGDRTSDIAAGHAAACRTLFIDLDYAEPKPLDAHHVAASLGAAADIIVSQGRS